MKCVGGESWSSFQLCSIVKHRAMLVFGLLIQQCFILKFNTNMITVSMLILRQDSYITNWHNGVWREKFGACGNRTTWVCLHDLKDTLDRKEQMTDKHVCSAYAQTCRYSQSTCWQRHIWAMEFQCERFLPKINQMWHPKCWPANEREPFIYSHAITKLGYSWW